MKNVSLLAALVIAVLTASCGGTQSIPSATAFVVSETPVPTLRPATLTPVPASPTASKTPKATAGPTATGTAGPTATATAPPEARLHSECLSILPELPNGGASGGVIVLEGNVAIAGRSKRVVFLQNLAVGKTITVEGRGTGGLVSPDRTLRAYYLPTFDEQDQITARELVIADASGQQLKDIPWEEDWYELLGWADNQQLLFHQHVRGVASVEYDTYLVLNPFTGQRRILGRRFPNFISTEYTQMPYWGGWWGVLYDPSLTRVIYPRNVGSDREDVTYGLWDVSKGRLLASFEDVFKPLDEASLYYMPTWTQDGSQFVFEGLIVTPDVAEFELYRVSRDGNVEQLTHLNLVKYVEPDQLSWSPNGRFIAMYLQNVGAQLPQQQSVAILDTVSLEITDFCFHLSADLPAPIWSPDGQQFLVSERSVDHPRVILVDIVKGFAAQIGEDVEATGWMLSGQ